MSQIRASQIRVSQIRVSQIRTTEISSNHRELHRAIFGDSLLVYFWFWGERYKTFVSTKLLSMPNLIVKNSIVVHLLMWEGSLTGQNSLESCHLFFVMCFEGFGQKTAKTSKPVQITARSRDTSNFARSQKETHAKRRVHNVTTHAVKPYRPSFVWSATPTSTKR